MATDDEIFGTLEQEAIARGFTVERSADGSVLRLLRADGTVALQARRREAQGYFCASCYSKWTGGREDHSCS